MHTLTSLGWKPFFLQQLTLEELEHGFPGRIVAAERDAVTVWCEAGEPVLHRLASMPSLTVGDWVLLDAELAWTRLLDRQSVFSRKAPGSKVAQQLIAANVDTAFLVASLNHDLNLNRLERYLALIFGSGALPVVVLTKADLCDDTEELLAQVTQLAPQLQCIAVNALDSDDVRRLSPWCGERDTVLFLGSSGVGKSTLINTLLGEAVQSTGGIREDDSKGRHTTTSRSLHQLHGGALLIDTPGMRELQLADLNTGLEDAFEDISTLAQQCRFADCQHESEPGCAVQRAVGAGELSERRLLNFHKLDREQAHNSASLHERREREKGLSKFYLRTQSEARRRKNR